MVDNITLYVPCDSTASSRYEWISMRYTSARGKRIQDMKKAGSQFLEHLAVGDVLGLGLDPIMEKLRQTLRNGRDDGPERSQERLQQMWREMVEQRRGELLKPRLAEEADRTTRVLDAALDAELSPLINSTLGHCEGKTFSTIYLWSKDLVVTYQKRLYELLTNGVNLGIPSKERRDVVHETSRLSSALSSVVSVLDTIRARIRSEFPPWEMNEYDYENQMREIDEICDISNMLLSTSKVIGWFVEFLISKSEGGDAYVSDDPLGAYNDWLQSIGTPEIHRSSVVFSTYWLAKETTGIVVDQAVIDQYGSVHATAETIAHFVRQCVNPNDSASLDDPVDVVPGIGPATAEILRTHGKILTVRALLKKFNSFSGKWIYSEGGGDYWQRIKRWTEERHERRLQEVVEIDDDDEEEEEDADAVSGGGGGGSGGNSGGGSEPLLFCEELMNIVERACPQVKNILSASHNDSPHAFPPKHCNHLLLTFLVGDEEIPAKVCLALYAALDVAAGTDSSRDVNLDVHIERVASEFA